MARLFDKMLAMEEILLTELPYKDKITSASQQLSGLELTKLSASISRKIKQELAYLNSIVTQYPINTFNDYELMNVPHLHEMVDTLMRICQRLKKFAQTNYALRQGL
jgi:flagellar biosynthesis/type III secretory pathway chaperone